MTDMARMGSEKTSYDFESSSSRKRNVLCYWQKKIYMQSF